MTRSTRAGRRHDDGPIPADYAARIHRERVSALLALAAVVAVVAAFGQAFLGGM
jgi:hypothetical protein